MEQRLGYSRMKIVAKGLRWLIEKIDRLAQPDSDSSTEQSLADTFAELHEEGKALDRPSEVLGEKSGEDGKDE